MILHLQYYYFLHSALYSSGLYHLYVKGLLRTNIYWLIIMLLCCIGLQSLSVDISLSVKIFTASYCEYVRISDLQREIRVHKDSSVHRLLDLFLVLLMCCSNKFSQPTSSFLLVRETKRVKYVVLIIILVVADAVCSRTFYRVQIY